MSHDWPMYAGQLEARIQELEAQCAVLSGPLLDFVRQTDEFIGGEWDDGDWSAVIATLRPMAQAGREALATDAGKAMQTELACLRAALGWVPLNVREAIRLGDTAKCEAWAKRGLEIHDKALEEAAKAAETYDPPDEDSCIQDGIAAKLRALKTGGGT